MVTAARILVCAPTTVSASVVSASASALVFTSVPVFAVTSASASAPCTCAAVVRTALDNSRRRRLGLDLQVVEMQRRSCVDFYI